MSEELMTREEVDQRLAEEGLEPGKQEYVEAFMQRFVHSEITTPNGQPLYVEVDHFGVNGSQPAVAAATLRGS